MNLVCLVLAVELSRAVCFCKSEEGAAAMIFRGGRQGSNVQITVYGSVGGGENVWKILRRRHVMILKS
jgi:hypothetical protein